MSVNAHKKRVYKVVLTGGPCGGKTTGQERLAAFFEGLGWRVFRVPETATILLGGGVKFADLSPKQSYDFQVGLMKTMMTIEDVYFKLGDSVDNKDVLIICDRGTYDPSAYMDDAGWHRLLQTLGVNAVEVRDNRYNQIVHMVTAADGAEDFYTLSNNTTRSEGLGAAREQDRKTHEAWIGHPYFDIVENTDTRNFEDKIKRLIQVVCDRANVYYGDRLAPDSIKRKFLVVEVYPEKFPKYEEFIVLHDYLNVPATEPADTQIRIRKRGKKGAWNFSHTTRHKVAGKKIETRMQISDREYSAYRKHRDPSRSTLYKRRRCFMFGKQYYHLDFYEAGCPSACRNLMLMETYTTVPVGQDLSLPDCVKVAKEVTGDLGYSMYHLAEISPSPVVRAAMNGFLPKKAHESDSTSSLECP